MPAHRRPSVTHRRPGRVSVRRAVTAAVAVASVGVLTAVTLPAIAGTDQTRGRSPSPSDPPPVTAELAPELRAALQRDLGLSGEQARDRLSREAWASQTVSALRADLDERQWGGAWLSEGADRLMVAVTDERALERVAAAGAEPRLVSHSQRDLEAVKTALDRHAGQAAEPIAGWYVDVAANTVAVVAPDWAEPAAREFAAGSGVAEAAVRVVASDEQPRLLFDILGGDAYFIEDAARCSIGFSVEGGFVTAGHCALAGTATTGFNGEAQGEFVAASFPGVGENGPDDWGVVATNDDWVPLPLVTDFEGGTLPVAGAEEAPVGASICKHGSTTGVTCGVIEAKDATVNYPEGTVTGLTRTNVCAEGGDSGGSWLSGDQAQGVTSGGSGNCTIGGTTFFQPLNEILEANGLTLVTTDGAGEEPPPAPPEEPGDPEPEPPAVTACEESEFTFEGQLTDQRTAQIQPNGRFYRALAAGTHSVCLAGPSDADFNLVLQQWTGESWQTVAGSDGPTASELVTFDGAAGFYRVGVIAGAGTGTYLVGVDFAAG
jgi:streptogrisin C